MKNLKIVLFVLVAFLALGWVGHEDQRMNQLEQAASVCGNQTEDTTPTFDQCMSNQTENNSDR